jgi:hypothetical protein
MEFNQCNFLNSEKMEVGQLLTTNKIILNRSLPKNYRNRNQSKKYLIISLKI